MATGKESQELYTKISGGLNVANPCFWKALGKKIPSLLRCTELRKELEALREEIKQEKSMAEVAESCMAVKYLVHLYYTICHIDWDYSCEPTEIKGTHYGPDIAQPIYLGTELSRCFISNYLWSLVSTDW